MPLSRERVNELRGNSERRIERYRATRAKTRDERLEECYKKVAVRIDTLTARELYISGLILYWAEGTKAAKGSIYMTNTDPAVLKFFIRWMLSLGVELHRLKGYLHLYADMDITMETEFWARELGMSTTVFRKPYVKESFHDKRKNYKGRFGHGTCNVYLNDARLYEEIMAGIEYIRTTQMVAK